MERFHFPLEKVLRWRSLEFLREQECLKRLLNEQVRLQTLAATLSAEKSKLDLSLVTLPDLRGDDLRVLSAFAIRLRRQAEELASRRARSERDLAAQQKRYNHAKQRVRLLEELRADKLKNWKYRHAVELEQLAAESYLATWNREER
ncbi:MAG: hypothetical protein ABSB86_00320 [Bryobacteraceae bacterium]|jgi:hypothetical protein